MVCVWTCCLYDHMYVQGAIVWAYCMCAQERVSVGKKSTLQIWRSEFLTLLPGSIPSHRQPPPPAVQPNMNPSPQRTYCVHESGCYSAGKIFRRVCRHLHRALIIITNETLSQELLYCPPTQPIHYDFENCGHVHITLCC